MNEHYIVEADNRARLALCLVREEAERDGIVTPAEAVLIAACEDTADWTGYGRAAEAVSLMAVRPARTDAYRRKVLDRWERDLDELTG